MPASNVNPEQPDPLIGVSFYDFVVERKLAQGGMGAVYLLRHERYPIRKVLKVILAAYADRPDIRERFEREAYAVASLKHPNIAKIDSVGTINGQPCMLIPFLEGQPLDAYLAARDERLRPHEVLHIATQISRALHYAHGERIIHRDLKPGNVFVEPTDDDPQAIQVLDFGIAKQLKNQEPSFGTSGPLGTPEYMAVEQFEHPADVTPAADIWALAIMIWEMCTGRRPWTAPNPFALYDKQLREPPEPPAPGTLSPAWELILRKALSPNPRMRPQSMPALIVPLAHALPANPPGEPSGVEVVRRHASKWLDEVAPGPSTMPISSPPPGVPVWSPGIEQGTPPGGPAASAAPGRSTVTGQPAGARPLPHGLRPPVPTTLGSSTGVVTSSPAAAPRRKLALIGSSAAVLCAVAILTINSVGGRREGAAGAPAGPPRSASTPEDSSRARPIVPTQSETRPTSPNAPPPPPAAVTPDRPANSLPPAVPEPSTRRASPSREQPAAQSSAIQPAEPSSTPRTNATAQQLPPPGRSGARPPARAKPPATEVDRGTAKPPTESGPEQARPDPAQGSSFDPNAVGGRKK